MKRTIAADVIDELQERIHQIEGPPHQLAGGVATGFDALDQLLGGAGLKRGTLTEWVGGVADHGEGSGAVSLALTVAAHILHQSEGPGALVVVDRLGEADFYPVAAAQMEIPLERTIIVRPDSPATAWWAWEQSLRCPGVAVTFGWIDALDERVARRLQLAAESGGGLGFLLRRPGGRPGPAWAMTRVLVRPGGKAFSFSDADSLGRRLRLSLARGRGSHGAPVEVEVELPHEASNVPLVSQLADPAAKGRPRSEQSGQLFAG